MAIGLGCDRDTSLETLEAAIAEATRNLGQIAVRCLATIDRKGDEPAILALSARHGWPLRLFPAEELARIEVPNPSATVLRVMGTPSVSEAAALLAAGASATDLLVEKHKHRGADGKNATLSIARWSQGGEDQDGAQFVMRTAPHER